MTIKIVKGTTLLETEALYYQGKVYLPADALNNTVGLWKGDTVLLDSPLAGKKICVTVLSSDTYSDKLPSALEQFLALCTTAGANIIYHDGGKFPAADLILAIEPGSRSLQVNYLGAAFRCKPLASKIVGTLKRGLKLAYLADPAAFNKPQYNLKLSLWAKLFTPAIALQWPLANEHIGQWLFASLMEYYGGGGSLNGSIFSMQEPERVQSEEMVEPPRQIDIEPEEEPEPTPIEEPEPEPSKPSAQEPIKPRVDSTGPGPGQRISATMSRAQYPDFFAALENRGKRTIQKEPFT